MSVIRDPEIDHLIPAFRRILGPIYDYLEQTSTGLDQIEQIQDMIRHLHAVNNDDLFQRTHERMPRLRTWIKTLDNTVTVMNRELTHLDENLSDTPQKDRDPDIQAVSMLLLLSVRIATIAFPPMDLQLLAEESDPSDLDTLCERWQGWLVELLSYLKAVLPLANNLVEAGYEERIVTDEYRRTVQELLQVCQQFPGAGAVAPHEPYEVEHDDNPA